MAKIKETRIMKGINMNISKIEEIYNQTGGFFLKLSKHARNKMSRRGISKAAILAALDYGRIIYTRKAMFFILGRKQIKKCLKAGINLSRFNGIQVLCAEDGTIITMYKNKSFKKLHV